MYPGILTQGRWQLMHFTYHGSNIYLICSLHFLLSAEYCRRSNGREFKELSLFEMANPNMVACPDENADGQSSTTTQQKETALSSKQPSNDSPSVSKTGAADVPLVWRSLESQRISTEASRIIMQSWRSSTTTQYQTYHKKWESVCCRRNINPLQTLETSMLLV